MNQKKYLERIGCTGQLLPSLPVLQELQLTHLHQVPFENLNVAYGIPIVLDPEKFYKKIVENRRGGFCYELNGLFYELLLSIGFEAKRISARVYSPKNGYGEEFDHMAILVKIQQQEYLVDVGFGKFTRAPLKMEMGIHQKDFEGVFRIVTQEDGYYRVEELINSLAVPQYLFSDKERTLSEYKGMCNYHQTSPDSPFTQKKLITCPTQNGRITLGGNALKITDGDQKQEQAISSEAEFREALQLHFNISVIH